LLGGDSGNRGKKKQTKEGGGNSDSNDAHFGRPFVACLDDGNTLTQDAERGSGLGAGSGDGMGGAERDVMWVTAC
jgi:hypothetical protein